MDIRPRRSVLYMPASNARALAKAKSLACDVVVLDLEDAVAPEQKELARTQACDAIGSGSYGARELVVRINGLDSPWGKDDLAAIAKLCPHGVLVPKVAHVSDLERVGAALGNAPGPTAVWAMIETPLGVLNVGEIAACRQSTVPRLACLVVGTNDLVRETRAILDADRVAAQYWLSAIVTAGRAYGLDVIDGVYNDFRDLGGCRREADQGRRLGMDGKSLIHPDQIAVANGVFAPAAQDIAAAEAIVAAFALPENSGKGVINLGGRMVELLHRQMAVRTIGLARAIKARSSGESAANT